MPWKNIDIVIRNHSSTMYELLKRIARSCTDKRYKDAAKSILQAITWDVEDE